jgi:hypothetical protein
MDDIFDRVVGSQDFFRKILEKIPGFGGYIDRQNRRASDFLLRQQIGDRYEEQWGRISGVQRELISQGQLNYVGDMEAAGIKIRQFIDRVKNASYGTSSFFNNIKVNEEELTQIYEYDLSLLSSVDDIARAVDNVSTSITTDGLPSAIRHLTTLAEQAVEAFNRRSEVILGQAPESQ